MPELEVFARLIRYVPHTGEMFWRPRDKSFFDNSEKRAEAWNKKHAHTRADRTGNQAGYLRVSLCNRKYYAHRVAWMLYHGECLPQSTHIDHLNKNKRDNRICNLRPATPSENHRNTKPQKNNISGVCGVFWDSRRGKWGASIKVNNRNKHLGRYSCFQDAVNARKEAEQLYNFHPTHGTIGEYDVPPSQ